MEKTKRSALFLHRKGSIDKSSKLKNGLSQHVQKRYGIEKSTKAGLKKHKSGCVITLQIVTYSGMER